MRTFLIIFFLALAHTTYNQITYKPAFPNINFEFPVELLSPPDGSDRMFVVEQPGRIKVFPRDPNVTSTNVTTFLNISNRVSYNDGDYGQEIGLLGLAFHPDYANNGYFYVYYTTNSPIPGVEVRMVLSRFSIHSNNNNVADANSEYIIFQFDKNQNNGNHNGGKIAFGPDGYLYISFGDGGGGNDPQGNGQNKNTIFGSICRIDVDLDGSNPIETNPILPNGRYEIPSDNPFVGKTGLDEIYAYGIRNTWKFSFDNPTGRLWGADVGQNAFEEINLIENGKNYGWSRFEANSVANPNIVINETITSPIFFYNQTQGDKSITGGYVYRGSKITSLTPSINSKYIFGDYISGRVWALDYNSSKGAASRTLLFKTNGEYVSSFGVDKDGEIYFSDYKPNAQLYKLEDGVTPPQGVAVNGIGDWQPLDKGVINGQVNAIATGANGNVYHGGTFNKAGNITANNIAVWNSTTGWSALGSGANGTINALKITPNGYLYAAGSFTKIGGVAAKNIAVWNGTAWTALGTGIEGSVLALETDGNNKIYAAGVFETINGTTVKNIGFWNGAAWSALTDATTSTAGTNNEIRSLHLDSNGILYVGGNFSKAGDKNASRIATWNGKNWGTLGAGTSGFVHAIVSTPTDVFLGGNFAIAGTKTVNRIAKWNKTTSSWSTLGKGVNNNVNALLHDGTYLYVGGAFSIAFNTSQNSIVNHIARWSAAKGWEALGKNTQVGVDIKINDLSFSSHVNGKENIFAGGNFSKAGAQNANNTALWKSDNVLAIETDEYFKFNYYPNPTTDILNLSKKYNWVLTNSLGQVIKKGNSASLNLYNYNPGFYFLRIEDSKTIKIIKK
ncbi:PQQ-dependent sugar dehydrogenase [Polaribacter porphyrae]|uniref:Glucose dehydrogenase n=1 Tax=Polaribacter porphyrae TaxID=1137780 RepID=A0A2S7WN07_9FLAO|nr:PQQ-dependent sugar dehydrogenase [Polaribacter porphyrae]PQJ78990.1 glucose dehydrogenase [Polaribacter porphyrae]